MGRNLLQPVNVRLDGRRAPSSPCASKALRTRFPIPVGRPAEAIVPARFDVTAAGPPSAERKRCGCRDAVGEDPERLAEETATRLGDGIWQVVEERRIHTADSRSVPSWG